MTRRLALALNAARPGTSPGLALALAAEGKAPEWIHILPAGPSIAGHDGRAWRLSNPLSVVAAFNTRKQPIPIDFEHGSELSPPGQPVPTAGWVEELESREDGIWGRVSWTARGRNAVESREYRFLSPAFWFDQQTLDIHQLISVGLVHRPNLDLTALNKEQPFMRTAIAKALGLPETASEAEILAAINTLNSERATALNAAENPSLTKFVPRADYDQVLQRATNAEKKLADQEQAGRDAEATQLVEAAIKDGKIAPASKDHFLKLAMNSIEDVRAFIKDAPVIVKPGADEAAGRVDRDRGAAGALTENQKAVCARLGLSEADYAKALS